jgi:hypothetical protein
VHSTSCPAALACLKAKPTCLSLTLHGAAFALPPGAVLPAAPQWSPAHAAPPSTPVTLSTLHTLQGLWVFHHDRLMNILCSTLSRSCVAATRETRLASLRHHPREVA